MWRATRVYLAAHTLPAYLVITAHRARCTCGPSGPRGARVLCAHVSRCARRHSAAPDAARALLVPSDQTHGACRKAYCFATRSSDGCRLGASLASTAIRDCIRPRSPLPIPHPHRSSSTGFARCAVGDPGTHSLLHPTPCCRARARWSRTARNRTPTTTVAPPAPTFYLSPSLSRSHPCSPSLSARARSLAPLPLSEPSLTSSH